MFWLIMDLNLLFNHNSFYNYSVTCFGVVRSNDEAVLKTKYHIVWLESISHYLD